MPATVSPLRYPGGKTQLYSYIKYLLQYNSLQDYTYVEPFAGGAGLALKLLFCGVVPRIVINDLDPAIYAMWYSCLNFPEELINRIKTVPLTVAEWDKQKKIYCSQDGRSLLDLGFSALFLNRTNISGIVNGGVLGGRNQTGSSKIDARFNREMLSQKIARIYEHRRQISIYNLDACEIIRSKEKQNKVFYYIDPPYVIKGAQLYRNSFTDHDHYLLSRIISQCPFPWIVTYDMCDLVKSLYKDYRCSLIDVHYSAHVKRSANEFIFFSKNIKLPKDIKIYRE